jgi:hypothetical protein
MSFASMAKMGLRGVCAPFAALLLLLPGCGSYAGEPEASEDPEWDQVGQALFADSSWLFMPTGTSNRTKLSMCWQSSAFASGANAAKFAARREIVESAVANSWERHAWLDITWYSGSSCPSGAIPVWVEDNIPKGAPEGLRLNFTFNNWSTGSCNTSDSTRDDCVHIATVHEFGHVLGFDHEHNRDANGQPCRQGRVYPDDDWAQSVIHGDWGLGDEDLDSVMSYCSSSNGWLSSGDIEGLQAVYGGDGNHIQHNSRIAIRTSSGIFWRDDGAAGSYNYSKSDSRLRIRRVGSTSGEVQYGDKVTIHSLNSSKYLCGQRGYSPLPGAVGPGFYSPPQIVWRSTVDSDCEWTVQHSSGSAGGTNVDVNDPFDLYMKLTPRPNPGATEHTFEEDLAKLRMLKVLLDMGS